MFKRLWKKCKGFEGIFSLVLIGIVFSGCQSFKSADKEVSEYVPKSTYEYIQPDDTLEISLILPSATTTSPVPTQPFEQKVKSDGTINLYLIGDVQAAGKTPKELEQIIHDKYVPKYYTRATVTIRQMSRFFYVDGQVKLPGRFPHIGEITVTGAIAAAGGFTDYANKKSLRVIRSDGKVQDLDYNKLIKNPKLDLSIYPGDRIIVPRRWM